MKLLRNFPFASDAKGKPRVKKRKKLKKYIQCCVALILVLSLAAAVLVLQKNRVPAEYGIESGIITYEPCGEDITERVTGSDNMQKLISADGTAMYSDSQGSVYFETSDGFLVPLSQSEHNFTSETNEKQSVLSVTYLDNAGVKKEMFSNSSVKKNQFRIYAEKNSFSVQYLLGDDISESIIPSAVEKEKFEGQILEKLTESEQAFLKRQYFLYSLSSFTDEKQKKNILLKYPVLKEKDIYVLLNKADADSQVGKRLSEVFKKAGYTAADAASDNSENLISSSQPLSFLVTLDYRIENGEAVVSIPADKLRFYRSTPLLGITLNKYTVSADETGESLFLPYGNGCIINIGDKRDQLSGRQSVPVYGTDATKQRVLANDNSAVPKCTLPIFGCYSENRGMLAVIEKGASQSTISCERGVNGAYACAEFNVLQNDAVTLSGKTTSVTVGNDVMSDDITLRYVFFEGDKVDYSVFAEYYGRYLRKNHLLRDGGVSKSTVFSAGLIGGVTVKDVFLNTVPYDRFVVLSDYYDMKNMTDELYASGVTELKTVINGWNKGGLFSQVPGKVKTENKLSRKLERSELLGDFDKSGISCYTSAGFVYYYALNNREGKYSPELTALFADKSYARKRALSPVSKTENAKAPATEVISPQFYLQIAEKYSSGILKNESLDVGHLCDSLNSDYNTKYYYDRSRCQKQVISVLEKLASGGRKISCGDANQYALPYVSLLTDISDTAVLPDFIDYDIPFKQMLLHGSVDYTQSVTNDLNGDRHGLLKAIEGGAGLHFDFTANSDIVLKSTEFSYLNNYDFNRTKEKAAEYYAELKEALNGLENVKIESHCVLENGIRKVTYENGTVILVNLSDQEKSFGTEIMKPFSYVRTQIQEKE